MNSMANIAAVLGVVAMAAAASAQDVVKERQALMKEVVAKNGKAVSAMIRGTEPFDAVKIEELMKAIGAVPDKFVTLFPEGTAPKDGVKTEAKPAIWENPADFKAEAEKLKETSLAVADTAKSGVEPTKEAFRAFAARCKACHEKYSGAEF